MKFLSIFFFLFLNELPSFGQGNLQFNQVINYTGTLACTTSNTISPSLSVPAGKVWKIEKIKTSSAPYVPNGNFFQELTGILVNSVVVEQFYSGPSQANAGFWMKTGDIIQIQLYGGGCNANMGYLISIIEYNVVL